MFSQTSHRQEQPVCNLTTGQHAYTSISREGQQQVSQVSAAHRNIHGASQYCIAYKTDVGTIAIVDLIVVTFRIDRGDFYR